MPKNWRILSFWALVIATGLWIRWWGASGFPLEGEICENANPKNDCASYNVIFYSAWQFATVLNHWSALIVAFAALAIGYFTYTLKQSTDKLWDAGERQLRQAQSDFSSEHMNRTLEFIQLEEQVGA